MENDIREILISKEEIEEKVKELGETLSKEYQGKQPLLVCILKGAVLFMSDLARHMSIPIEMDFMAVSSYGVSTDFWSCEDFEGFGFHN